jgi:deoxyhypusine synthase
MSKSKFLSGKRIEPTRIVPGLSVSDLVDGTFQAYNAARLREGCHLLTKKMLEEDVTVGLTMTGALTPAGLGMSSVIPLIEAGFVDWIISTGANLYHDTHFGIGLELRQGSAQISDTVLREEEVVRIYDIFFDYSVLLDTDAFFRQIITGRRVPARHVERRVPLPVRQVRRRARGGAGDRAEVAAGRGVRARGADLHLVAGDSSIGMNVAAKALQGNKLMFDVNADVNETASIVLDAKRGGGKSAIWILGGGSPKNFALQTEPQIQEVMGIDERGHDYFLQITDARPDTGGLSGATPAEAVSWGKIDPDRLPDAVVCYVDSTIALPILAAYALDRHAPRTPKRLFDRREQMMQRIRDEYQKSSRNEAAQETAREHAVHQGSMLDRDR